MDGVCKKYWGPLGKKVFKSAEEFKKKVEEDTVAFLEKTEDDLNRWADLADEAKLTSDEG